MWKKVLVLAVLAFTYPVIECRKNNKDSSKSKNCRRTNSRAYRYCTKSCTTNKDCKENQECLCDGDCGFSCVRNNQKCEEPPKGNNLKLGVSNGRFFGSVVTYSCTSPYRLRGSAKRTCRATGEWDGKKAKCRIMCKDPGEITHGNRRVDGFQAGKTIQYWCFDAYTLEGSGRITCQNTGQWSSPKPVCTLPPCNPPPIPETASVVYPRRMPKTFRFSDRVLLKCKYGYFKSGTGVLQCVGNTWRGGITCSPKSCGGPGTISNGRVIGYVYSFKEKVRYVCDEGYQLKGPAYRQCQANEKWSGEQPICEVVNCGPLNKPQHGDIIEQVDFTFGNRIVFECTETGRELNGSRVRICQSDGTWSGFSTTCELVKCNDPGTPMNGRQIVSKGYFFGGSVTFACDTNYTLQGKAGIICKVDKSWSGSVPQCLAPCSDPGVPYQGNRIGNDFRHDHTVTFTCPRYYLMEGVSDIRCSNGKWSDKIPSCKAPCHQPAIPAHGWKWGRDFRHRHSVRFRCFGGYQIIGATSITCNDGTWDSQVPVCKGICRRPNTPNNGRLHGNSFLDGDEVTFSCERNYDLFGDTTLRCVGRTWNAEVPECKARCRFIGRPEHGYYMKGMRRVGDMIKHGEQISYGCLRGYTMVGANMQECNNGRWTNERPECKASCQSPGRIADGMKIGSDYGHGRTVQYQCNAEYTLDGREELVCNDGTWSFNPPTCKAPCPDPGAPVNGRMRNNVNLRHNSLVQFVCDDNHQLDGNQWIRCVDGSWSDSVPKCIAVCPDPGVPAHGKRLNNDFRDGKLVAFECNHNYDLLGSKTITCNGGVWSGNTPQCKGRCTFNGNPENGYTLKQNFTGGVSIEHNNSVEYACNAPYSLTGSRVLRCDDGKWNASAPSCKASCVDPGHIAHGTRNGNLFSHGQTVTYECNEGYSLQGNHHLECNDGNWNSDLPQCKASCRQLQPPANGTVNNNETMHGMSVSFSCDDGFLLNGLRELMCVNGNWTGSSPTCQASCKDPGLIKNGIVTGNYSYGSSITFKCNSGYRLRGSLVLTCERGAWNGSVPECIKNCKDPGKPQNGWFGNNYQHGGVVWFVCKNQTFDLKGAQEIKCNNGEWSGPVPTCEAKCNDPGNPANGGKEGADYRSGTNVTFGCNPPFELVGSRVIICKNGEWSDHRPTCSVSDCGESLGMENRKILDHRITSSDRSNSPSYARLNGQLAWCTTKRTYLQIDLGKPYKLTAISTQGGTRLNSWVKRYKVVFYVSNIQVVYSESGSQKIIEGNRDASSVVKYSFKEPFVARLVRIYPDVGNSHVCLRVELYGCDPKQDCILVGSLFWVLWGREDDYSINYYQAYITKLNATHINFALAIKTAQTRSYRRTDPVLIIDQVPEMKDLSINALVIAVFRRSHKQWYRAGTVTGTLGSRYVSIRFNNGDPRNWVPLREVRLVKRPRFCSDYI